MINFDKKYFEDIWGTVHRHDYCEGLADQLIAKYGKVRFLDIGTGCGYLVKLLNDKGAQAMGLEISDYAVANSHGKVVKGSVTNIPFQNNFFDVVCSQGLFGYFPEEEVQQAISECRRVGKFQEHNIDSLDNDPTHQYILIKDHEWWKNQFYPKILIACPNHEVKEYSFQRWIDNVKNLTYPNYDILVVDNSPTLDFMNRWKDKVPMIHIETQTEWLNTRRINQSMEVIRQKFLEGNYARFFSLESDVIPQADVIEIMLKWGKDSDWISHAYPDRTNQTNSIQGIGCSIFSRKLLEKYKFADIDDGYYSDAGLWEKVRNSEFKTMELWNYIKVEHLKE